MNPVANLDESRNLDRLEPSKNIQYVPTEK